MKIVEIVSMVLVGIFWGCTNPLLRQGSIQKESTEPPSSFIQSILQTLAQFRSYRVWLPYLLNQAGSLLYYFTLAQSQLSLAVPTCNALSLVFGILTSYILGERVDQPARTAIGASLVVGGVALCIGASSSAIETADKGGTT
jgi:uncharacterized membrane protein